MSLKPKLDVLIVGLDSEDDGAGTPLLFGIVYSKGQATDKTAYAMLERLQRLSANNRIEVWCTNLEYDLLNLFGIERIAGLQLRFGKSYLLGARWKGRHVSFKDTMRHLPLGVENLGELIGLPKQEKKLFDGGKVTEAKLRKRCLRDAAITYQVAKKLHELYRELKAEPKLTLASSAYSIWYQRHWKKDVRRPLLEHYEAAFEAYYGGRTEPFSVGDFQNVTACDASSMFPWAMTATPYPIPWGPFENTTDLHNLGFYHARIESKLDIPALPYRSDEGLIFPNGVWTGWYTGIELANFQSNGGKFRIYKGFRFLQTARPFDSYIKEMFKRKSESKGARRLFYKLLLNALYGKFGQRGDHIAAITQEQFINLSNPPAEFRLWAGLALFNEHKNPPPWGNMVWPALVTAFARVRLHQELTRLKANGCRLLYCDTDGILFQSPHNKSQHKLNAEKPGDFELRGDYKCAMIRAKKEYALQDQDGRWQFFVKGVPYAERETYLKMGEADFRRPTKLREAAKSGDRPNVWKVRRKTRHVNFNHRGRMADGSLKPVEIKPIRRGEKDAAKKSHSRCGKKMERRKRRRSGATTT